MQQARDIELVYKVRNKSEHYGLSLHVYSHNLNNLCVSSKNKSEHYRSSLHCILISCTMYVIQQRAIVKNDNLEAHILRSISPYDRCICDHALCVYVALLVNNQGSSLICY